MARTILDHYDFDVNVKDKNGHTPLMLAIQNANRALVETLLGYQKVDVNTKDKAGRTPLMHALQAQDPSEAVVRSLLDRPDIDLVARSGDGCTALSLALTTSCSKVFLEMILSRCGVEVHTRDNLGFTPLINIISGQWRSSDACLLDEKL